MDKPLNCINSFLSWSLLLISHNSGKILICVHSVCKCTYPFFIIYRFVPQNVAQVLFVGCCIKNNNYNETKQNQIRIKGSHANNANAILFADTS